MVFAKFRREKILVHGRGPLKPRGGEAGKGRLVAAVIPREYVIYRRHERRKVCVIRSQFITANLRILSVFRQ